MDVGATGSADYGAHAVLDDTLHADRKNKIQSVAGPDVTDQIGASVHASAMEGGDPNPGDLRDNLVNPAPKSFTPEYGKNTIKDAADLQQENRKALKKVADEKAAAEAAEAAKIEAQRAKETAADEAAKLEKLKASQPETLAGREEKEAKLAAAEKKVAEA